MNRDAARLADWFRELRRPLMRFLARRSRFSESDVEDLSQEVFLRMLRYGRSEIVSDPRGYLYKVAGNVMHDWTSRAAYRFAHDSAWLVDILTESQPDAHLEAEQRSRSVHAALLKLEPRAREILRLHFGESLSYEEVAQALSLSRRIVKREIARAYALLREELIFEVDVAIKPRRNAGRVSS